MRYIQQAIQQKLLLNDPGSESGTEERERESPLPRVIPGHLKKG